MKLTNTALAALRGSDQGIKERIAAAAGVVTATVYRWIQENHDNLTKAAVLKIIRDEYGLSDDQILEEESEVKEEQN